MIATLLASALLAGLPAGAGSLAATIVSAPVAQSECLDPKDRPSARLGYGKWTPEAYRRLKQVATASGIDAPTFDACKRPLAIIGFEALTGDLDPGQRLVQVAADAGALGGEQPTACAGDGDLCAGWESKALAGTNLADLEAWAARTEVPLDDDVLNLVQFLFAQGWDVFVIGSAPESLLRAQSQPVGLPKASFLGWRSRTKPDGTLTATATDPRPTGAGRLETVRTRVAPGGRTPALVVGTRHDRALLGAADVGVLFDAGDSLLGERARTEGWLLVAPVTR